jgi:glucosamine-6-phosphate deaminase
MKTSKVENLEVEIHIDREAMGKAAADFVEAVLLNELREKPRVRVVFAAAPSQNEMLKHLTSKTSIPWSRITAFHMDEYIGLPADAPQLFSRYLTEHLFSKVPFGNVYMIDGQNPDIGFECARYAGLLSEDEIDLVCMGIGENGHIAFNDPPVADFADLKVVKAVTLDEACRLQQVHDGCFPSLESVPQQALTITVPALLSATVLSIVVPGVTKAEAVRRSLEGEITTACPASILRTHNHAHLFLDELSASLFSLAANNLAIQ